MCFHPKGVEKKFAFIKMELFGLSDHIMGGQKYRI